MFSALAKRAVSGFETALSTVWFGLFSIAKRAVWQAVAGPAHVLAMVAAVAGMAVWHEKTCWFALPVPLFVLSLRGQSYTRLWAGVFAGPPPFVAAC